MIELQYMWVQHSVDSTYDYFFTKKNFQCVCQDFTDGNCYWWDIFPYVSGTKLSNIRKWTGKLTSLKITVVPFLDHDSKQC